MPFDENNKYMRATHYLAKKEDFIEALSTCQKLPVIAVYPNGTTMKTELATFMKTVRVALCEVGVFDVELDTYGSAIPSMRIKLI